MKKKFIPNDNNLVITLSMSMKTLIRLVRTIIVLSLRKCCRIFRIRDLQS